LSVFSRILPLRQRQADDGYHNENKVQNVPNRLQPLQAHLMDLHARLRIIQGES